MDYLHVTLQKALKQAVRDDLVPRNVAEGERPRSSRSREEAKAFSADQVRALLREAAGTRNHPLYAIAVHTGCAKARSSGSGGTTSTWTATHPSCPCAER